MRDKMLWIGIALSIGLSLYAVLATVALSRNGDPPKPVSPTIEVGNAPTKGPGDAAVTLIEVSDFECPFCRRFREETRGEIERQYAGRVRFAYKHFPVD